MASHGDKRQLWERVQWAVHNAGLSQEKSADKVGPTEVARILTQSGYKIGQPSVSKWQEMNLPDFKHIVRLAYLTGACVEWLWTGRGPRLVTDVTNGIWFDEISRETCRALMLLPIAERLRMLQFIVDKLESPRRHESLSDIKSRLDSAEQRTSKN